MLALLASLVVMAVHVFNSGDLSSMNLIQSLLLLLMGIALNSLCRRFSIIGYRSHLTMLIFAVFSCVLIPFLSVKTLAIGFLWLYVVFLAFDSWEEPERAKNNMIFMGIFLAVSQIVESNSILLIVPFFILFFQNAISKGLHYLLALIYFIMVLVSYTSILFATDNLDMMQNLIPHLSLDFGVLDSGIVMAFMPTVLIYLVFHQLNLRNYRFRYPNRSININMLFLYQLIFNTALVLFSSSQDVLVLLSLPASILLSVAFSFGHKDVRIKAAFYAFVIWSLSLSSLFNLLIL